MRLYYPANGDWLGFKDTLVADLRGARDGPTIHLKSID